MAHAPIPCDLCRAEEDVNFYCINCEETLCERCKLAHINSKRTKNDKVVPLLEANREGQVKSPTIFCDGHQSEEVTLYCEKCKQLLCILCMEENHKGHNIITLKTVKDKKIEAIHQIKLKLEAKVSLCANALDNEIRVYAHFTNCIEKRRNKMSEMKMKIIEEFREEMSNLCDVYLAELTSLQQNEDTRYSESCSNIKAQESTLRKAIQSLETSLSSGNPVYMTEVTEDITGTIQGLHDPSTPQIRNPNFLEENITRERILQKMLRKGQKFDTKRATDARFSDNKTNANKDQQNISHDKAEKSNSLTKIPKIKVKGKREPIRVIIALSNKTLWVADNNDKHLSLVDREGNILKESLKGNLEIWDAKHYENELLVSYVTGNTINKMSMDAQSESVFSALSLFYTRGLCVTSELDVLVCLRSSLNESDNKVVRLGSAGEIKQTIQYNNKRGPLYSDPLSVTSLPTGEIVVADYAGGIVCVSRSGDHIFTWKGEVDGVRNKDFKASYVTHDNSNNLYVLDYDNDKVYVLQKQGTGARCLMDIPQRVLGPSSITVDDTGNLLIGCEFGEIHVSEKLRNLKQHLHYI